MHMDFTHYSLAAFYSPMMLTHCKTEFQSTFLTHFTPLNIVIPSLFIAPTQAPAFTKVLHKFPLPFIYANTSCTSRGYLGMYSRNTSHMAAELSLLYLATAGNLSNIDRAALSLRHVKAAANGVRPVRSLLLRVLTMFELHFAGSIDNISVMEMIDPLIHLHHDPQRFQNFHRLLYAGGFVDIPLVLHSMNPCQHHTLKITSHSIGSPLDDGTVISTPRLHNSSTTIFWPLIVASSNGHQSLILASLNIKQFFHHPSILLDAVVSYPHHFSYQYQHHLSYSDTMRSGTMCCMSDFNANDKGVSPSESRRFKLTVDNPSLGSAVIPCVMAKVYTKFEDHHLYLI
ncbi:hypothetical protein AGLY_006246 [Aphis glycines]|uniref:Uncharacterized protein n=1 Tax=Aphis glycines TaxID=307491 RepID=A0A6G0TQP7_APHGL|nr:hypothetical protein AGLY_006246 [Aphis glycines]